MYSLVLSAVVLVAGSMITYVAQDEAFLLLMAIPGFVVSLVWISICFAQLKLRRSYTKIPSFKVWGFPYVTTFAAIILSIISLSFVFSEQNRISIITCLLVLAALTVISIFKFKRVDGQEPTIIKKDIIK